MSVRFPCSGVSGKHLFANETERNLNWLRSGKPCSAGKALEFVTPHGWPGSSAKPREGGTAWPRLRGLKTNPGHPRLLTRRTILQVALFGDRAAAPAPALRRTILQVALFGERRAAGSAWPVPASR